MKKLLFSNCIFFILFFFFAGEIKNLLAFTGRYEHKNIVDSTGNLQKESLENKKKPASTEENIPEDALVINRNSKVSLITSNGCGLGNFLIPSTGNPALDIPPVIGALSGYWSNYYYKVLDTIPGKQILGVAFKRSWTSNSSVVMGISSLEPYVVISDTGFFSYWIDERFNPTEGSIHAIDSIYIPGILKNAKHVTSNTTNPIVLLVEDPISNYRISLYSYPGLQEQFSIPFYFKPEIFEITENSLYVTAWDSGGSYKLYQFSVLQDSLQAVYTLNASAANAQEFLKTGDSIFILSSPGDSTTILSTLNIADSSLTQNVVYTQSAARATHNEFMNNRYFTFQPVSDTSNNELENQILVLDPVQGQVVDTLMLNLRLDEFKHPPLESASFGHISLGWIGARWKDGITDSVFLSDSYNSNIIQIQTGAMPWYINSTFGCWAGVSENELEEIKFKAYPNPASSEVTISLFGLTKGRKYKLNITDVAGKVHYTTNLEAYQEFKLPVHSFPNGIYFLNLDTGLNIISKKLMITTGR